MKIAIIILLLAVSTITIGAPTDKDSENDTRILGGSIAPEGAARFQASLRTNTNAHFCSGSIISYHTVVTAAHCIADRTTNTVIIVVGTHTLNKDGYRYLVGIFKIHSGYDPVTHSNDIGLVISSNPIANGPNVAQIRPGASVIGGGVSAIVTGWGTTSNHGATMANNLQMLPLQTITVEKCKTSLHNMIIINDNQLCTFIKIGQGICRGDSGSPLVDDEGNLIGIVSWGFPCAIGVPDVFTRVSSYISWINSTIV